MSSWFCQQELEELSAGLTCRQKHWASAIGAVSIDSGGLSTGIGTLNYYLHCGHRPALTSSPGAWPPLADYRLVFSIFCQQHDKWLCLGHQNGLYFFEIAAFIVFQQLFRMICRTGSYTMNAEGGLNILQTLHNAEFCFISLIFLLFAEQKSFFILNVGSLTPFWSSYVSPPTQFQRAKLVSTVSKIIGHNMPNSSNTAQPCNRLPWLMSLSMKRGKKTGRE